MSGELGRINPVEVRPGMRVSPAPSHIAFATVSDVKLRPTPTTGPVYEFKLQEGGQFYVWPNDCMWIQQ